MALSSISRLVSGAMSRVNDLVIRIPDSREVKRRVVYFGGDVQDLECEMRRHGSNHRYATWSLEATAEILSRKFGPRALVVVVRPSEYYLGTFSLFRNFVACSDSAGSPSFDINTDRAWRQLDLIMEEIWKKIIGDEKETGEKLGLDDADSFYGTPLAIVGFSKGCAVLNQFVHEFVFLRRGEETDDSDDAAKSLKSPGSVKEMYWLDGGHNGTSDTWVTNRVAMEAFSDFYKDGDFKIFIHVTPYQMNDGRRPHIGRHKAAFCELVKTLGISSHDQTHFANQNRTIDIHFDVLTAF